MHSCLITGVDGLIGSNLAKFLALNGWRVYGVGRRLENNHPDINYIQVDLSSNWSSSILPKQVDAIIHLAQSEFYRDFPHSVENLFSVNTVSTLRLLDYARSINVATFILASSGGIYGYSDKQFTEDEDEPASPFKEDLNFYLGSKLCSEIISENFTDFFNIITLRFFFVYGPSQKKTMLIPRLMESVRNGVPILLQGEEGIMINPTYVDDAVRAIFAALNLQTSHKINIGGPEVLSLRKIVKMIGDVLNQEPKFTIEAKEPKNLIGDIKKMSAILVPPKIDLFTGINYLMANNEYANA